MQRQEIPSIQRIWSGPFADVYESIHRALFSRAGRSVFQILYWFSPRIRMLQIGLYRPVFPFRTFVPSVPN